MADTEPDELAVVVGRNARKIRTQTGATLEDVAREARLVGLKWTTGKVGDLEAGRMKPSLQTLLALSLALASATEEELTLPDLVEHDGPVRINDRLVVRGDEVAAALRGEPLRHPDMQRLASDMRESLGEFEAVPQSAREGVSVGTLRRLAHEAGETESRIARELGISNEHMLFLSAKLWGMTFTQKRNELAGENGNPQKRGRFSRILKGELRQAISDGNN